MDNAGCMNEPSLVPRTRAKFGKTHCARCVTLQSSTNDSGKVTRMLTILALYFSYTGDSELLLKHFAKAKALAEWLLYRRSLSLKHSPDDPRYGIPPGDDEADNFNREYFHKYPILHFYSSAAELYRACNELGKVPPSI